MDSLRACRCEQSAPDLIGLVAQFGRHFALRCQIAFSPAPLAGDRFQLHLALGHIFGKLCAQSGQALNLCRCGLLLAGHATGFTRNSGQKLVHLGELVLEIGGLAEQPEHHHALLLDGPLVLPHSGLQLLAHVVLLEQISAGGVDAFFQFPDRGSEGFALVGAGFNASLQTLHFGLALRHALFDSRALATWPSSLPRVRSDSTFSSASCLRAAVRRASTS